MFLSATSNVVELTVVVVPSTVRLPLITTAPVLSPIAAGSITKEAGPVSEPVMSTLPVTSMPEDLASIMLLPATFIFTLCIELSMTMKSARLPVPSSTLNLKSFPAIRF